MTGDGKNILGHRNPKENGEIEKGGWDLSLEVYHRDRQTDMQTDLHTEVNIKVTSVFFNSEML